MSHLALTIVFETTDGGWIQARIRELPAVITAAPTREEAREMLLDALREYLLSLEQPTEIGGNATTERLGLVLQVEG